MIKFTIFHKHQVSSAAGQLKHNIGILFFNDMPYKAGRVSLLNVDSICLLFYQPFAMQQSI